MGQVGPQLAVSGTQDYTRRRLLNKNYKKLRQAYMLKKKLYKEPIALFKKLIYNREMKNLGDLNSLEAVLRQNVNKSAMDQALLDYKKWAANLKEEKIEVVHLLYLLKATEQRSGNQELKKNRRISEIILTKAEIPDLDRRHNENKSYLTLLQKEIGKKYQIDMEFESPKGTRIKKSITELGM